MRAVAIGLDAMSAIGGASTAPFALEYVTLTKLEYIQLVMEAKSWKSLHQRAVSRLQQLQNSTKRFVAQLREHAEQRDATFNAALALVQEAATQREAALRAPEFGTNRAKSLICLVAPFNCATTSRRFERSELVS